MSPLQGVTAASSLLQVLAMLAGGRSESKRLQASQDANEYNAAVNRSRAETSSLVYGQQEERQRRAAAAAIGEAKAGIGESGLGFGGSNADVLRQQEVLAELDALNVRYEGQLERHSYQSQATLDSYYGRADSAGAKQARLGSYVGAAGALLSGVGDYYRTKAPKTKRPVRS